MVILKDVKYKYFYGATALENLSIEINEGDKIAVFGKSFSGKTTLLKIIANLLKPTSGTVEHKKAFSTQYIFSNGGIFRFNTFQSNITKSLKGLYTKEDIVRKLQNPYNYISLAYYRTYGFLLDTDDIVRLNMERIYQKNADLVLVDNIFNLLNIELRSDFFNDYIPLFHDINSTVIFATNNLDEALTIGDKIIFLNNGKIDTIFGKHDLEKLASYSFKKNTFPYYNELEFEFLDKDIKVVYELSFLKEGSKYNFKFYATHNINFIYKSHIGFIEIPSFRGFSFQENITISKIAVYDSISLQHLDFADNTLEKIHNIIMRRFVDSDENSRH